jgi:hypothetical protein
MAFTRLSAIIHTARLDHAMRRAERRERDALARAGEALAAAGDPTQDDGTCGLRDEILEVRCRVDAFSGASERSLAADRADYVTVSRWMRPLVVARGLCDCMVLRHQRTLCIRGLRPLHERLGAAAMAGPSGVYAGRAVPAALAEIVRSSRSAKEAAAAERALYLAPFQGAAVPALVSSLAVESRALGKALVKQLRSHFIPRASALAGLAAGWWVADTFTDSHWRSALRSFGIGRGGTHVVSAESFQAMSFWLPILSAAICAYLGDRMAHFFRHRYEAPAIPSGSARLPAVLSGSETVPPSRAAAS